ncbi:hypothetical protein KNP414_02201 [Paenibacillus mucilaginosus KNP414]|uniref:Uncharacterized protein n=1 Tax=Paenibacillus mucilaginosus (strain KNP414) TaxID=1036673 RepID=F8F532_PAEMK|nr:hypothetical protein KNP414_02201 [Paenibacillus mucilaginosus KNP414]
MKHVGKPYAGKPHVRFDEDGGIPALNSTYRGGQEKGAARSVSGMVIPSYIASLSKKRAFFYSFKSMNL